MFLSRCLSARRRGGVWWDVTASRSPRFRTIPFATGTDWRFSGTWGLISRNQSHGRKVGGPEGGHQSGAPWGFKAVGQPRTGCMVPGIYNVKEAFPSTEEALGPESSWAFSMARGSSVADKAR